MATQYAAQQEGWEEELKDLMPFTPSRITDEAYTLFTKTISSAGDVITGAGDDKDIYNLIEGTGAYFSIPVKNIKEEYLKFKGVFTEGDPLLRLLQTEWQANQEDKKAKKEESLFDDSMFEGAFEDESLFEDEDMFAGVFDDENLFADVF